MMAILQHHWGPSWRSGLAIFSKLQTKSCALTSVSCWPERTWAKMATHTHYTHSFVCFYIAASSSCMISFPLAAAAAAAAYSFWKPNINTKSVHVSVLAAVLFGCLEGCLGLHFSSLTLPLFSITQAKSHWVTHKLWLRCGLAVA